MVSATKFDIAVVTEVDTLYTLIMESGGTGDIEKNGQPSQVKNDANKGADVKLHENSAEAANKDDGDLQGMRSLKLP